MNFDLSDDQVALRDGIRSLLEGKLPMSRVRDGFDRSTYEDLREAGVFSLRADGFGWADAAVVYEELGRACVPGPLVWTFARDEITGGLDLTQTKSIEFWLNDYVGVPQQRHGRMHIDFGDISEDFILFPNPADGTSFNREAPTEAE